MLSVHRGRLHSDEKAEQTSLHIPAQPFASKTYIHKPGFPWAGKLSLQDANIDLYMQSLGSSEQSKCTFKAASANIN